MTVKSVQESKNQSSYSDLQNLKELPPSELAMSAARITESKKPFTREVDLEKIESPKSVGIDGHWTKNNVIVHHQILKIREEDSHLGEDIGEGLSTKEKLAVLQLTSQMDAILSSRSILPSSPLSGKTAIKSFN